MIPYHCFVDDISGIGHRVLSFFFSEKLYIVEVVFAHLYLRFTCFKFWMHSGCIDGNFQDGATFSPRWIVFLNFLDGDALLLLKIWSPPLSRPLPIEGLNPATKIAKKISATCMSYIKCICGMSTYSAFAKFDAWNRFHNCYNSGRQSKSSCKTVTNNLNTLQFLQYFNL